MRDARSRGGTALPSTVIVPASYGSTPAMHSNSVVFPDPLGPIKPSTSPWRIDSETSATAVSRPYDFVSPPIDTMGTHIWIEKVYRRGVATHPPKKLAPVRKQLAVGLEFGIIGGRA